MINYFRFQALNEAAKYATSEGENAVQFGFCVRVENAKNRPSRVSTAEVGDDIKAQLDKMAAAAVPHAPARTKTMPSLTRAPIPIPLISNSGGD